MGQMIQKWNIDDVINPLNVIVEGKEMNEKYSKAIMAICRRAAIKAHSSHSYKNIKGQLESSVGIVVLRDRKYVDAWEMRAKTGSDPSLGLQDLANVITTKILGKAKLPDGTVIPAKGIIGIVFAAAPYASIVQDLRGRTVLDDFMPEAEEVFRILKTVRL